MNTQHESLGHPQGLVWHLGLTPDKAYDPRLSQSPKPDSAAPQLPNAPPALSSMDCYGCVDWYAYTRL